MYKKERACNSINIEILNITKINRFQIAFPVERSPERTMQYTTLHCDGRSFSYEIRHRMQYTIHLPVHAVYKAVHLWWRTTLGMTGDSAAADDKLLLQQHMTVVNDLAGVSIGTLAIISVVLQ